MLFISFFVHYFFLYILFRNKLLIIGKVYQKQKYFKNKNRSLSNAYRLDQINLMDISENKMAYISSTSNEKGEIYLCSTSEDIENPIRLLFKIKQDFSFDSKIISINSPIYNKYPLLTIIKIVDTEYIGVYTNIDGHFEIINFDSAEIYYSPINNRDMKSTSNIFKNTFISLKYLDNSYVFKAFINKSNSQLKIEKLYFSHKNIKDYPISVTKANLLLEGSKNSPFSCFEIGNYIECLYINSHLLYIVSVFNISNLNNILNKNIEEDTVKANDLFSKCIYIKNNIGAFFYFIDNNQFPKLQFQNLEINQNKYILNDYFHKIDINSQAAYPLERNYIYNDFIKTNENTIYFISAQSFGINIYIIQIKLLNMDKNILISYYNIKVNEVFNTGIYKDITAFSLNGLLGLGLSLNNFNYVNKTTSAFFLFGNLTLYENISINLEQNTIFNEESLYEIEINEIINKINIQNNIFGNEIAGIKIISSLNEENGFYIYSTKLENQIKENQTIVSDDFISFKIISEIGVQLNEYYIEYEVIIKEPEYDDFISNAESVDFYPKNGSNNIISYKSYFKPEFFVGKKSHIFFQVNECYKTCQNCSKFGDNLNHHCSTCSTNYPFSCITTNGINCLKECPDNYITSEENICLYIQEIINLETNIISEEILKEENKSYENEKLSDEVEREKEKEEEKINDTYNKNNEEEEINIEENNNIKVCKKYYYIDEKSKIHCIDGEICIDEYPHLDKNIENLCTNCIYKYNNKCYMDCPENTCIKQDINLDTCIDIDLNTKVINKICFENFQNIVNNIKEMSENNIIIENIPNLTVYIYDIEKNISNFEEKKLTYINFKDIQDSLIKDFSLEQETKIYALIVDSPSKYSNSTINDYGFILLLENGTELNLSNISEDLKVKISIPIVNLELANFNYANILSEQGYDIYDINSEFYHDICTPGYLDDNDIAFKDRKSKVFPNDAITGKTNCEYQLSNINNQRLVYNCYLKDINKNNTNNNMKNNFEENEKKENLVNYILDVINYKVLNCSILFINLENYRHNKAVMICTTSIFISVLLLIIFFCSRLSKIRILMFKEIPTIPNINKLFSEKINNNPIINKNNNLSNPNNQKNSCSKKDKRLKKKKLSEIQKKSLKSLDTHLVLSKTDLNSAHDPNNNLSKKRKRNANFKYKEKKIVKKKYKDKDKDEIEYDDLPFQMALRMDNRKILFIFKKKVTEKIKILDIFINKIIKEILLSEYFLYLLIDLTMNAMLYSDNIVSHKSHNNGKLDTIIVLLLSAFANILSSIIGYYLELLIGFEERIIDIKEIKKEIIFLRVFKIIMREIIIRVIIFFIFEILIIIFCTYYLFIFFTIYHKSQMSLLKNYLISLIESWTLNILIAILIILFRKIGIYFKNKYIYNISKYLDKNF